MKFLKGESISSASDSHCSHKPQNAVDKKITDDSMKHRVDAKKGALGVICYLLAAVMAATSAESRTESLGTKVEGIAAVVGGEIILLSQVNDLLEYELDRRGETNPSDSLVTALRSEVLDQLIDDRLLVDYARRNETDIDDEQIDTALQERIDQIKSRFPSESSFIAQLEAEGLTMSRFRTLQRKAVEEQLLKQRLQESLRDSWRLQVTDSDIEEFCQKRADEIPDRPERVALHHILLELGPPPDVVARAESLLESVRQRIVGGEPFSALAREYSQDGSATLGGDLGTFEKGSMVPEFESALKKLEPGEISGVVKTRFGLHIIQLLEKSQNKFRARHIIRLLPQIRDPAVIAPLIQTIKAKADTMSLSDLAREYSQDSKTKDTGGFLEIVAPSSMEPGPLEAFLDTTPIQTLSEPIVEEDGVHLYWITERIPEGKPPCDEIAPGIRDLLFMEKFEAKLNEFLAELKDETYVEVYQ